jgi:hypothetical protein
MLRKRRGNWHYRFQIKGQTFSGNTGSAATERNRRDALNYEKCQRDKVVIRLADDELRSSPTMTTFIDGAAEFLAWCEKVEYRNKPNTWKRIRVSFTSLMTFFWNKTVAEITPGDVE